ncbi:MAG: DUF1800 family protein [Pseudorhodoplanes sp.]
MALDPTTQAAVLLNRFGFVPKKAGLSDIGIDARSALLAEFENAANGQIKNDELLSSAEAARATYDFRRERRAARIAARTEDRMHAEAAAKQAQDSAMAKPDMQPNAGAGAPQKPDAGPGIPQQIYREEAKARFDAAFQAEIGLTERLVWFWSNHFCVSADKGQVRPLCGAFEREAIRPHIRGKFADMLMAVESHPAMLLYLDNARSMGPNSPAGLRQGKGLNENLAREILELHTLGVNGGYSQNDVTSFAKVITGWSVVPPREERGGEFLYNTRMHEPGPRVVLGREFPAAAVEQGQGVLLMLARHPATAKHIAFKLARHFVADTPPQKLVDLLAKRFSETDGDLKEVTRALILSPEASDAPRAKLRRPDEWLIAIVRASGVMPEEINPLMNAHNILGQPLWRPPAPIGFSDEAGAWLDGISGRLDIANQFSRRMAAQVDARAIAESVFGALLSQDTRQTLARAESQQQALALLLMSPEFQRR